MTQKGIGLIVMSAVFLMALSLSASAEQGSFPGTSAVPASPEAVHPLLVSSKVPQLTLMSLDGKPFDLNAAIAAKPTIVVFYRGGWCQYCAAQLAQLQEKERELKDLGFQIIAVSPDRPDKIRKGLETKQYPYMFLSDSYNIGSQAFGVAFRVSDELNKQYKAMGTDIEAASGWKDHVLPIPAVFIIGSDNVIKFEYANPDFRVRLDNDVLVAAAKAAIKPAAPDPVQKQK
jgi:peroxiredoxin